MNNNTSESPIPKQTPLERKLSTFEEKELSNNSQTFLNQSLDSTTENIVLTPGSNTHYEQRPTPFTVNFGNTKSHHSSTPKTYSFTIDIPGLKDRPQITLKEISYPTREYPQLWIEEFHEASLKCNWTQEQPTSILFLLANKNIHSVIERNSPLKVI